MHSSLHAGKVQPCEEHTCVLQHTQFNLSFRCGFNGRGAKALWRMVGAARGGHPGSDFSSLGQRRTLREISAVWGPLGFPVDATHWWEDVASRRYRGKNGGHARFGGCLSFSEMKMLLVTFGKPVEGGRSTWVCLFISYFLPDSKARRCSQNRG